MPELDSTRARRALASERGFTLIEVMVATLILAIGVFATVGIIDAANRTTGVTRSREAAVNIARAVIEGAHAIDYSQLEQTDAPGLIQALPGLADSSGAAGWQVTRRGITYTLTFTTCAVDDPADGTANVTTPDYCTARTATNPPDPQPADYKRVTVQLDWRDGGGTHTLTQSGIVASSYHGPSITGLTGPTGVYTGQTNPGFFNFSATSTTGTNNVHWFLDSTDKGTAVGGGTSWVFNWNLGQPVGGGGGACTATPGPNDVEDGTYIVRANAYDAQGLTGNSRAVTVQINRCPPLAVTGLMGGKNYIWPGAELQWDASPEEDVVGYYVYTSNSSTGPWTQVTSLSPDPSQPSCSGLVASPNCVDNVPTGKTYYAVRAVDTDPNGSLRTGDLSAPLLVDPANSQPGAPGGTKIPGAPNNTPYTIQWDSAGVPSSPPPNDYTDFYYVYRDSLGGRAQRYDSISVTGGAIIWTDPDPGNVPHDYWVTAVDNHLAESYPQPQPNPLKGAPNAQGYYKSFHCDPGVPCVISQNYLP